MLTTSRLLIVLLVGLACVFPVGRGHTAAPLCKIKWSVQLADGSGNSVCVIHPDCIVAGRGTSAVQVVNSQGEILLVYPGERIKGREESGLTFRPDGSYYRVTRHTENYKPDKPYIEVAYCSLDGTQHWSKMLTKGQIKEGRIIVKPDGFMTVAPDLEKTGLNQLRQFTRITKFGMDGEVVWTREREREQNGSDRFGYSLLPMEDGTFRTSWGTTLTAYSSELEELWTYTAYGVRRDFVCRPDGTAYALLKAPERLIKVGPDGELAWSCNISEHASGHINDYYETGHAFGDYLTVGAGGTVYVCDAYSSLTAISPGGEYLWSVQDPRRADQEGDKRLYVLEYPEAPVAGPDGTIYLKSDERNLMAVSAEGEALWVDRRFVDIWDPPAISPDGTVYVESGGWLYALDPEVPAVTDSLAEQEAVVAAERERDARWEAERAVEREELEEELARVEAEGGDRDEYLADLYGFGEPKVKPDPEGPYIADRTEVAGIIIEALQQYYAQHREYPPFLKGVKHADDPLIAAGLLAAYPLMWPQPGCHCGEYGDWQHHVFSRWGCKTPPPEGYGEDTDPYMRDDYHDHCGHHGSVTASNYFGYRRGDFLGRDSTEAWLWFYGSNIWPEQNNPVPDDFSEMKAEEYYDLFSEFGSFGPLGLDLENSRTHELSPDGTPDGICLLYRFRDGKLTEVIRAEGI